MWTLLLQRRRQGHRRALAFPFSGPLHRTISLVLGRSGVQLSLLDISLHGSNQELVGVNLIAFLCHVVLIKVRPQHCGLLDLRQEHSFQLLLAEIVLLIVENTAPIQQESRKLIVLRIGSCIR